MSSRTAKAGHGKAAVAMVARKAVEKVRRRIPDEP
jgi:hypothetical protein